VLAELLWLKRGGDAVFWCVLDQPRQALLKKLTTAMPVPSSYLAGGTALALLLGHRISVDFDWFTPAKFDPAIIERNLSWQNKVMVTETRRGTFHGLVDGIQVTWLWYPNPLLKPLITVDEFPGLNLASLLDIGLMKLVAASQRGARKDFIDLYMICQQEYSLEAMLALLPQKFPESQLNYYHIIKSLSFFDDAEREAMPTMRIPLEWQIVKEYFLRCQKKLLAKASTLMT
jgi:hypothetical protein